MRWPVAGLFAAVAAEAVLFGGRLATGAPTPLEVLQDRLLELLPGPVFGFLIDTLGFAGKPLLLLGLVAAVAALGALLAIPYGRWWPPGRGGRRAPALAYGLTLGVAGELALAALGADAWRSAVGVALGLVAALVYGAVLGLSNPPAPPAAAGAHDPARRRALALLGGGATLALGGEMWGIVAAMGERGTPAPVVAAQPAPAPAVARPTPASTPAPPASPVPARPAAALPSPAATSPTSPPLAALPTAAPLAPSPIQRPPATPTPIPDDFVAPAGISAEVTPGDQFYVVSKNEVDPDVALDSWSLEIGGMVDHPQTLGYAEVTALPAVTRYQTLECISNRVGGDLMSTAEWTGARLADLLARAGVQSGANSVGCTSADGYTETLPLDKALDPTTLLAYRMNGEPLSSKHGFPLRVLLTGRYGMKNPKWLTKIEVGVNVKGGFWERQGWNRVAEVKTTARFDVPATNAELPGPAIELGGVAFGGDRGIAEVEVSANNGTSWQPARLKRALGPYTWVLWAVTWKPSDPGSYTLRVRATDGGGAAQIADERGSYPSGASGYHTITVQAQPPA